jgi:hypothetical protein
MLKQNIPRIIKIVPANGNVGNAPVLFPMARTIPIKMDKTPKNLLIKTS